MPIWSRIGAALNVGGIPVWLDALRADTVVGWRRLNQAKVTSLAVILSLSLAIGAGVATFRLVDALLLRPLPVAGAERLYAVAYQSAGGLEGIPVVYDSSSYPMFERMRDAARGEAAVLAASYVERVDLTYASDQEMEKAQRQFVSGDLFTVFGLRPALGRLLTSADDRTPGAHPLAVLSHEYWVRRFAADPQMVGRTLRMGERLYEIVGVAAPGFNGTETGMMTDIFVPIMMGNPRSLRSLDNFWVRTLAVGHPGIRPETLQQKFATIFRAIQEERARGFHGMTRQQIERHFQEKLLVEPAAAGRSNLQRDYGRALGALGVLVALVLLIACANAANLMTVRAAGRSREMALRLSIGAGRGRLVQLVLVESALMALLATGTGAMFAWWSAPLVVRMIHSADEPVRLDLSPDWRVMAFALVLTLAITALFGLPSALRGSAIRPASTLKGETDRHSRKRLMHFLIAAQVAFCFLVLFTAGLFVATFERLSQQPLGFRPERVVNLETVTRTAQAAVYWEQVAGQLRGIAGVEAVGLSGWPVMSGESNTSNISTGATPATDVFADSLNVSAEWFETLQIPVLDGRTFRGGETGPGVAIVNQAFARQYFDGTNPVGRFFERVDNRGGRIRVEIVGSVPDARSRDRMRVPIRPTFYSPMARNNAAGEEQPLNRATFVVRTAAGSPAGLAAQLRQAVGKTNPAFRVSNIRSQSEIIESKTIRERMLAVLAVFFAALAILLAGIGLYGVLDYSILQQRREIGIRLAVGAAASDIARRVTAEALFTVMLGALAGIGLAIATAQYLQPMLYAVRGGDFRTVAIPCAAILTVAAVATLPAVLRAVRIDPIQILRME